MPKPHRWITVLLSLLLLALPAGGAGAAPGEDEPLVVGVAECEPFVIALPDGNYAGISIELFKQIAAGMEVRFTYRAFEPDALYAALEQGQVDVAVTCTAITAAREKTADFSQAYFQTNVTAATRRSSPLASLFNIIMSQEVLLLIAFLVACSAAAGFLIWLIEHEINPEIYPPRNQFERTVDVFLSGATFIINGGSDYHVYKTVAGRVIAVAGKIINTIFLTGVTAIVVSVLSTALLHGQISEPNDLKRVRVGVLPETTAEAYLMQNHVVYTLFDDIEALLEALGEGKIEAALHDESILRFYLMMGRKEGVYENIVLQPWNLKPELYGFLLPPESPRRRSFDEALLDVLDDPDWEHVQKSYFQE